MNDKTSEKNGKKATTVKKPFSEKPKAAAPAADAPAANANNSLPLFFERPVPMESTRHAKAGIQPKATFRFAADTNSIPVNLVEFAVVAKSYPIVFTNEGSTLPAALVGLERGNYFVSAKGDWKDDTYIPSYVRKYPFAFMEIPERKQFVLCVDEKAPHYSEKQGEGFAPFYENGQPSAMTKTALEFCTAFHTQHQQTKDFCAALKKYELLTPHQSENKLHNGRVINLRGFQLIDEKKVQSLPEAAVLELHKKGYLPYIYFAMLSVSNWKRLLDMASVNENAKSA